MDLDADRIKNERRLALLDKYGPALEKLGESLGAFALDASQVQETHDRALDLGNRAEDAIKRLDDKVREVGDLPARLQDLICRAEEKLGAVDEHLAACGQLRTQLEDAIAAAKPEKTEPVDSGPEAPKQSDVPKSEGGQDGQQKSDGAQGEQKQG